MTPLSDDELTNLLQDLESDRVERKETLKGDAATKVRETICAFANDLPGYGEAGVVFIGATDDGIPSGIDITDDLMLSLASMKDDGNIVPPPTMTVTKRRLAGADMAVVQVQPSDTPPVSYKGRCWIRTGPRRALASAQDERILNERRRHGDRPFDIRPIPGASLTDLDSGLFEREYLPSAVAPDVLAANERTLEERLAAAKMVVSADQPIPTVLGVLTLGTRTTDFIPGAYAEFVRINGEDLSGVVLDAATIGGTAAEVIQGLERKIDGHVEVAVDLTSSEREIRRWSYPRIALQQIVRNAVMHRTYEATNSPIRIYWMDNRVEIISPGGTFGLVNAQNFGQAGATEYRNPNLAESLRVLGFVQRFGVGLSTARKALMENGNGDFEATVSPTFVGVTVRRAR